jgi:hypothetical protein
LANPGVAPVDASTNIGKLRYTISDVVYTELVPPVSGQGSFLMFSDTELGLFLENASDSILGAAGYAFMSLAGQAALAAKNVKDADLAIDSTKRAADLRAQAQTYFSLAEQVDGTLSTFDIVDTSTDPYVRDYEYYPYPLPPLWRY